MISKHFNSPLILIACCVLQLPALVSAAPDDVEATAVAQPVQNFGIADANFDQWLFQGDSNADGARARMTLQLKLQLDEMQATCGLTDAQRQKLLLAARGDLQRFFDDVEKLRAKFLVHKNDPNGLNDFWQELQLLQQKLPPGLFGAKSLFAKTMRTTLSAEQIAQYRLVTDARRKFRHRAAIEASLVTFESSLPLRDAQHHAIVKLLLDSTEPPPEGQSGSNHMLIAHSLAKLPEDQLKPLLDERQWKFLEKQRSGSGGIEMQTFQSITIVNEEEGE